MDVLAQLFNIKDSSNCIMGGILMDTNPTSGHDKNCMMTNKVGNVGNGATSKIGVYLYQTIKDVQEVYDPGSFKKTMLDTWITGFTANYKGIPPASNLCSAAAEILDSLSILKTSQLLKAPDQDLRETLFYFLSFYGTSKRILDLDKFTEENKNKLIDKGMVSPEWSNEPLPVRYVIRKENLIDGADYLYFIGGSPSLLRDDPTETIDTIKEICKSGIRDIGNKVFRKLTANNIWHCWDNITDVETIDQKDVLPAMKFIEFHRILAGIVFIRNQLLYAYREVGIDSLVEFNGKDVTRVKIKKLLDSYEAVYQYSKTISLLLTNS